MRLLKLFRLSVEAGPVRRASAIVKYGMSFMVCCFLQVDAHVISLCCLNNGGRRENTMTHGDTLCWPLLHY
jgi:hypothetical protein